MTNPQLITTPFAENGTKNTIPESGSAEPQLATMQAGFPEITQRPISDGGIPPDRADFNGILNMYGQHIVHLNKGLAYEFDQDFADKIGGYPLNARIMLSSGEVVQNTQEGNTNNPNNNMGGWKSNTVSKDVTVPTYKTAADGVNPVTGVADGAYFNVRSEDDDTVAIEYQNVGGSAVATGKSYPSGSYVETIAEYTALPFKQGKSYALYERVQLDNGDIVKSTVSNNVVDPNERMAGWELANTSLNTSFSTLNRAISRVIEDRFLERVSVKDFGAIGDGSLHTLQEWVDSGKFSGLVAIQVVMPFVTALTQSIDWAVTQYCLINFKNILVPKGKYVFSDVAKFPDNISPFDVGTSAVAPRIFGDGVCTTITRNDERPATRIMNAGGTSTTQESDTANLNEACFSVHCPYACISDLTIESSAVGIYFGQDFTKPFTQLSSVSKSNINRVQINRCGTGVLMLAAGGNHYVDFSDIHFTSCQIDVHQRASFWWKITQGRGDANNNRNCFTRIRSGRSRVGYWNDCGDTNTLLEWHGEGINHTTANNPYPVPDGLPAGIPNGSCMFVFTGSNQLNKVSYCNLEQVGYHVYNAGSNNTFSFNLINEAYVKNVNPPKEWFGRYVTRFRGYGYADNAYPEAFPELSVAGRAYFGLDAPNGTAIVSNNKYHIPTASTRGSYDTQFQVETGAIVANTAKAVQLWGNIDPSSCAMINVDIVGRCDTTGQISSFNTKVMANAYRTTARALTRFGVTKISSSRATYEGTLDTIESNHIAVTLQKNATTPQILEAVLSCPFDLTSATVFVDIKVMK